MLIKATLFTALVGMASMPVAAGPLYPVDHARADAAQAKPLLAASTQELARNGLDILVMRPGPDVPGDVMGRRGPNPHARALREIAIYTATGNRDGAEILTGELHRFGVTRQAIQRSIDRTNLHAGSPSAASVRQSRDEEKAEAGWETSQ